jgi:hypothetical protein
LPEFARPADVALKELEDELRACPAMFFGVRNVRFLLTGTLRPTLFYPGGVGE